MGLRRAKRLRLEDAACTRKFNEAANAAVGCFLMTDLTAEDAAETTLRLLPAVHDQAEMVDLFIGAMQAGHPLIPRQENVVNSASYIWTVVRAAMVSQMFYHPQVARESPWRKAAPVAAGPGYRPDMGP
jgi:hypothetical protein